MSIDFQAEIARPLPLGYLVAVACRVEADLLGLAAVPPPALVAGRRREWGRVVYPGRPLAEDDLRSVLVGPRVPDPLLEVVDDTVDPLVVILPTRAGGGGLVFMPARRAVPVMTALALAVAAAIGGGGRFVDLDLQLAAAAGIGEDDPVAFVAATRLPPRFGTVAEASDAYLRRFEHLRGWHLP